MSKISKLSFLFAGISLLSMLIILGILGDWVPYCWVALGLTVFFVGFGYFKDRQFFGEFFSMKTTKEGLSMGVLILLMMAVLAVVNYLGAKYYKTWDLSTAQTNTLSLQSVQILKNLDSDLKVLFFYKKGVEGNTESRQQFRDLVTRYRDVSSRVQLDFIEVNERPDIAKEYGVDRGSGVVFVDYKGNRNRVEKIDEQSLTSAIIKVTRGKSKVIYFTVGHREKDLNDNQEALGLGALKLMLDNNHYTVKELPLARETRVPADADVVVIAGPAQNFQDFEIAALEQYLKTGGSLFLALETMTSVGLEKLLAKAGLVLENNNILNVVDTPAGTLPNGGPTMGSVFSPESKITKNFGREFTLFRNPQGIKISNVGAGMTAEDLVSTTPDSLAFKTLQPMGEAIQGSFALVSEVTGKFPGAGDDAKTFSLIVAGDVDFMSNQMLYQNLNRDLVLNSLASLAKEDDLISISAKEPQATQMFLTETKFMLFLFAFIIPMPLLLLGTSIGVWMRRRNA